MNAGIEEMVGAFTGQFSPEKIILVRLLARGEARHDSDVDLLVLFSHVDDPRRRPPSCTRLSWVRFPQGHCGLDHGSLRTLQALSTPSTGPLRARAECCMSAPPEVVGFP